MRALLATLLLAAPVLAESPWSGVGARSRDGGTGVITSDGPVVMGSLDKEVIRRVMQRHRPQVRQCALDELRADAGAPVGKLRIKFLIGVSGKVSSASVEQTTLHNPRLEGCVTSVILAMEFPAPRGGGVVLVTYPYTFAAAAGDVTDDATDAGSG